MESGTKLTSMLMRTTLPEVHLLEKIISSIIISLPNSPGSIIAELVFRVVMTEQIRGNLTNEPGVDLVSQLQQMMQDILRGESPPNSLLANAIICTGE